MSATTTTTPYKTDNDIVRCKMCGQPIRPEWRYCVECGNLIYNRIAKDLPE